MLKFKIKLGFFFSLRRVFCFLFGGRDRSFWRKEEGEEGGFFRLGLFCMLEVGYFGFRYIRVFF